MQFRTQCNTQHNSSYNFIQFEDVSQYKGQNIDITGRASVVGVYSRNPLEKREIVLSDSKEYKINAVTFNTTQ
jgi:hypothetical protein